MPELPEVETIRRDLAAVIVRKKIKTVDARATKVVRDTPPVLRQALMGESFTAIERIGKLLIFTIGKKKQYLLVHLKMTGQLLYQQKGAIIAGGHSTGQRITELPNAHTRIIITFSDNSKLFFNDMRLFAYMELADETKRTSVMKKFGIEPLTANFTFDGFTTAMGKRTAPVKAFLLNQALVAGIGNIYADEACFVAGIRPGRRVHTLTAAERKKLFEEIPKVLELAIKKRGTTFNKYVDGAGRKGNFVKFLKVYGRGGKPCVVCETPLKKVRVAGRGTVYCVVCQK